MGQDFLLHIGANVVDQGHVLGVAQGDIRRGLALLLALDAQDDLSLLVAQGPFDGDGAVAEVVVS